MRNLKTISVLLNILLIALSCLCIVALIIMCMAGVNAELFKHKEAEKPSSAGLEETFDYGEGYIKKIVFVGDRTIAPIAEMYTSSEIGGLWLGEQGTLALDYNLSSAPVTDLFGKKYSSISDAAKYSSPQFLVITVGIDNGVGYCSEEKLKDYYVRLIDSIKESSPDTKIILQSVFPVSRTAHKKDSTLSNDRIRQANEWIAELCTEKSVRYLDTFSTLSDKNGYLLPDYDGGDGIILNKAGYDSMLEYIRTHGYN